MSQPETSPSWAGQVPPPLLVAAGLVAIEGILTLMYGIAELISTDSARMALGLTTGVFLAGYGIGHLVCAWGMRHLRPWARGPMLMTQLIWLGLAFNLRSGSTSWAALGMAVIALVVLAGLLHPRSVDVLNRDEHRSD